MDIYFWFFALVAVASSLFLVLAKDPLPGALSLLTTFISLAALYLHLHAPLVAIFQITIYAGAILVLVVFVIMLLMTPDEELGVQQYNISYKTLGAIAGVAMTALLVIGVKGIACIVGEKALPSDFGQPGLIGKLLYSDFLLHFEVVSVLLLVALVGAIYISKRNL